MPPTAARVRRLGRRAPILLAAVTVAALTLPALAAAAAPVRLIDSAHMTGGRVTTPDGTVQFDASYSTLMGWNGRVTYWGSAGVLIGSQGISDMTGSRLTGQYVLGDEFGEFAGLAPFVIDFTAAGPEVTTEEVIQDGNSRTVLAFTQQPMLASGAITMPDGTVFAFTDLQADRIFADQWSTNPAAKILDGSETFVDASWMLDGTLVGFRVHVSELARSGVVYLYVPGGEIIGTGQPALVDDALVGADFTLTHTDGTQRGSASVALTVTELGSSAGFERTETSFERVISTDIAVTGQLTLVLDGVTHVLDFADADLFTLRMAWHGIEYPFAEDGQG
jgi:hypothetical protein